MSFGIKRLRAGDFCPSTVINDGLWHNYNSNFGLIYLFNNLSLERIKESDTRKEARGLHAL